MNRTVQIILCICMTVLCSCKSPQKKKDPIDQKLGERLNPNKKDILGMRSRYEKFMNTSMDGRGTTAAHYQKQMHHDKSFNANKQFKTSDSFKTKESPISKWKFWGKDSTFAGADKASNIANKTFDAGANRDASKMASDGSATFSGADNVFGTKSALTRSQQTARAPHIIDDPMSNPKGGAYSESEVKRLMNRN